MTLQKQTTLWLPLLVLNITSLRAGSSAPIEPTKPITANRPFTTHPIDAKPFTGISLQSLLTLQHAPAATVSVQPQAAAFVKRYLQKNDEALRKTAARSQPLFQQLVPIFQAQNLPAALVYLAVVESDLRNTARSRVGAVGLWQLMGETARDLGLHISPKNDERRSTVKSTRAAARYLAALYKVYGDWLLVLAAYNAGPGVVDKAIRLAGSRNFWRLQRYLPAETRGHVKRYIATHVFFEGAGGETTLTKGEWECHQKQSLLVASTDSTETGLTERNQAAVGLLRR